ncbi:hypothetical protein ACHAWF_005084 [Thalassiosira exigua]
MMDHDDDSGGGGGGGDPFLPVPGATLRDNGEPSSSSSPSSCRGRLESMKRYGGAVVEMTTAPRSSSTSSPTARAPSDSWSDGGGVPASPDASGGYAANVRDGASAAFARTGEAAKVLWDEGLEGARAVGALARGEAGARDEGGAGPQPTEGDDGTARPESNGYASSARRKARAALSKTGRTAKSLYREGLDGARAVGALAKGKRDSGSDGAADGGRAARDGMSSNGAYDNWRCDDDGRETLTGDDLAWKIISTFLKGWCGVWVLFAILVVSAELFSPKNGLEPSKILVVDDEQAFLELSEAIVSACSYSNLDTAEGRGKCKALCRDRMCCFDDERGCEDDVSMACPAYAGCEALVVSEEDAIIYDAEGTDVFGIGDSSKPPPSPAVKNSTTMSELELIREVVTSVCARENLHTRRGMLECAALCGPSLCCFDRDAVEALNPRFGLKLKMEGITSDVLDLSSMGTCANEDQGGGSGHFCRVHAACENILLVGSPPSTDKLRHSSAEGTTLILTNFGAYESNESGAGGIAADDQSRTLVAVCLLLVSIAGFVAYLLVCRRAAPPSWEGVELTAGDGEVEDVEETHYLT